MGCLLALPLSGFTCDYPDEGGMPLRRAVAKVRILPEVEAMGRHAALQYILKLDEPVRRKDGCYWPVEVRADGKPWRRYLVSPDGKKILR